MEIQNYWKKKISKKQQKWLDAFIQEKGKENILHLSLTLGNLIAVDFKIDIEYQLGQRNINFKYATEFIDSNGKWYETYLGVKYDFKDNRVYEWKTDIWDLKERKTLSF